MSDVPPPPPPPPSPPPPPPPPSSPPPGGGDQGFQGWQPPPQPPPPAAPQGWQAPPGPTGPPPAATGPDFAAVTRESIETLGRDPGAWALAGIIDGVLLTILASLIAGTGRLTSGVGVRARYIVLSQFASSEVAAGLLLAIVLAYATRTTTPAAFRRPALFGAAGLAAIVGIAAIVRAFVEISYGHAFGFGGFFDSLAAVPVAAAAVALGVVIARQP